MRKIFLAFSLVVFLISGAFAQTNYEETNVLMADHKIMELGDKYLALLSNLYPEEATRLGTGIYHDQLLQRDKQSEIQRGKSIESLQKTLLAINPKKLSVNRRMQYYTLLEQVNKKVFEEKTLNQLTQDPLWYLESLTSVYDILEKKYTSNEDRLRDIIKRLEILPQILEQGQENLENAPDLRMRLAAQKAQIAYSSFGELSNALYKMAKVEQTQKKINTVSIVAREALKKYADFLRDTLEKKEYTDFRLGEENYSALLKDVYFLSEPISKYQKTVEAEIEETQKILKSLLAPYLLDILSEEEQAQRTDEEGNLVVLPSDYYLVRNTKFSQTPTLGEIAPTYASVYQQASQFFTEQELFVMPDLALSLQKNPQYLKQPYTASLYLPPYPFAARQSGDLLLNIPSEEDTADLTNLFTYSDIRIDAVQKMMPGIHLSYNATLDSQQVLTNISNDMFYVNGWAAYSLKFAQKAGFFEDEADNLNIAWLNYKRALYALADIKMQTKTLNYTQTLDMLISAGINDEEATERIDFLAINPANALSYVIGAKEFEKLNLKYQKKLKDKFNQLEFDNKILSLGRVPLNVLAEGLEQSYKTKPVESFFNTMYF
jgi:Uncharacterized protein conserved in bacteria